MAWLTIHTLGILWTNDPYAAFEPWKKAFYLASIPIFMGAFGPKLFKKSLASYILGIVVYHFILHAMHLGLIEFESLKFGGTPFIPRIHYSPLLLFTIFILAHWQKKWSTKYRIASSLLIISLLVSLIIIEGRSGQILFAIIIPFWVLLETRKWIYFWGTVLGIFITLCILFTSLHSFQKRYVQIQEQWDRFQKGDIYSSMGQRFHHIRVCWSVFLKSPVIGHGTGSYRIEHDKVWPIYERGRINYNPHNQYLMSGVQFGIVGLILFISLFFMQIRDFIKFNRHPFRPMLLILPVMFSLICFIDTHLYGTQTLTMFIYMSSILYHPDWKSYNQ
ncbi:MAG: O-antigen ligase family protein [bacterium]|nr:O-antigen ligase family protein [bacterium]